GELEEQLGWSTLDVDTFVALESQPDAFTVVTGDGIADRVADDLVDTGDGIVSTSDADDGETDPQNVTPADQYGRPVHLAGDGDRLALSHQSPTLQNLLGGPGATLADDASLASIAAARDDAGAVSAVLDSLSARPVGIGWAADDDHAAVATIAFAHGSEAEAASAATELETLFTEGTDALGRSMSELYTLEAVTTVGSLV